MEQKSARMQAKYASMDELELAKKIKENRDTNLLFHTTKQKKSRQETINYTILMKEMRSHGISEGDSLKTLRTLEDMGVFKTLPDNSTIELTGKGELVYRSLPKIRG